MAFDFDAIIDRRGTGSLKWDAAERFYGREGVIPLWVADMDFPAPPPVVEALRRRVEHSVYGYPLPPRDYWEPVIRWLSSRQHWDVQRDWLVPCPGVVPALNTCVQALTRPGDKIVIQTPVYHPFYSAVENNGRGIVRNPLRREGGRWTMDLDGLGRAIDGRTRLLILCSPHNPVGRVWTREELEPLGRLCLERGLVIVSDEIHSDLISPGHRHLPLASLGADLALRTIALLAPSKTFNLAGLTTAFAVIPDGALRKVFQTQVENQGLTMGNVLGQSALYAAYAEGAGWLDELRGYLDGSYDMAADFFSRRLPGLRFLRPEGTYLALVDGRELGLEPGTLFKLFLEKAGVYLDDGTKFGPELAGFFRLNMAAPRVVLREAFERIERALRAL